MIYGMKGVQKRKKLLISTATNERSWFQRIRRRKWIIQELSTLIYLLEIKIITSGTPEYK